MQFVSKYLPDHLPKSMRDYRDKYEHHLILKMGGKGVDEARAFLKEYFAHHGGAFSNATPKKPSRHAAPLCRRFRRHPLPCRA